jgi:hypothetical protein
MARTAGAKCRKGKGARAETLGTEPTTGRERKLMELNTNETQITPAKLAIGTRQK